MEIMTDKLKTDRHYAICEHLATIGEGLVAPTPGIAVFQPPARGGRISGRAITPRAAEQKLPNVEAMTEMGKSSLPLAGETGFINEDLMTMAGGDLPALIYYLDKPPAMVEAVRQTLKRSGVDGDDIRREKFYGY